MMLKIAGFAGAAVVAFLAFGAIIAPSAEQKALKDNPAGLVAEDVVVMGKDAYGCEFQTEFAQAIDHYQKNEFSAWSQITNRSPWCFKASSLNPGQSWTVLQIRDNVMQISQTTLKQYQSDPDRHGHTYWTAAAWGAKVQP